MDRVLPLRSLLFAMMVVLLPALASAIPQGIALSGHVTDAEGTPRRR